MFDKKRFISSLIWVLYYQDLEWQILFVFGSVKNWLILAVQKSYHHVFKAGFQRI